MKSESIGIMVMFGGFFLLFGLTVAMAIIMYQKKMRDINTDSGTPWHSYPVLDDIFSRDKEGPWDLPAESAEVPVTAIEHAIVHYTGIKNIQRIRPGEAVTSDFREDRIRLFVTEDGGTLEKLDVRIG